MHVSPLEILNLRSQIAIFSRLRRAKLIQLSIEILYRNEAVSIFNKSTISQWRLPCVLVKTMNENHTNPSKLKSTVTLRNSNYHSKCCISVCGIGSVVSIPWADLRSDVRNVNRSEPGRITMGYPMFSIDCANRRESRNWMSLRASLSA